MPSSQANSENNLDAFDSLSEADGTDGMDQSKAQQTTQNFSEIKIPDILILYLAEELMILQDQTHLLEYVEQFVKTKV